MVCVCAHWWDCLQAISEICLLLSYYRNVGCISKTAACRILLRTFCSWLPGVVVCWWGRCFGSYLAVLCGGSPCVCVCVCSCVQIIGWNPKCSFPCIVQIFSHGGRTSCCYFIEPWFLWFARYSTYTEVSSSVISSLLAWSKTEGFVFGSVIKCIGSFLKPLRM